MILTLRLLAILGLFALSTIPFAMAEGEDEDDTTVIVDGDPTSPSGSENPEEED